MLRCPARMSAAAVRSAVQQATGFPLSRGSRVSTFQHPGDFSHSGDVSYCKDNSREASDCNSRGASNITDANNISHVLYAASVMCCVCSVLAAILAFLESARRRFGRLDRAVTQRKGFKLKWSSTWWRSYTTPTSDVEQTVSDTTSQEICQVVTNKPSHNKVKIA
jgi:hypothetical protein